MKKSKKFILAVLAILLIAIGLIIANPDWVDNKEETMIPEQVEEDISNTVDDAFENEFD